MTSTETTVERASIRRENNLNLLRLIAASAVLFSHAFDFQGEHDWFFGYFGYSGGWLAVSLFFSMSGYLIYNSIMNSRDVRSFTVARCLRIFPGLIVMLLVTTVLLGLFASTAAKADFFSSLQTWKYVVGNAVLYVPQYFLPGVFEGNIYKGVVNGSLWTLRFEFTCYILTLLFFVSGFYKTNKGFVLSTVAIVIAYVAYIAYGVMAGKQAVVLFDGNSLSKLHRLYFAFFLGVVYAKWEQSISINLIAVLVAWIACFVLHDTILTSTLLIVATFLSAFWIAGLRGQVFAAARKIPDVSYGIYIYAFPIQQLLAQMFPHWGPLTNASVGLVLTIIPATLSWYLVEKPALKFKSVFSRRPK
ncbi:acyltransferase [Caulobacter sp. CCH9-E1]|uniref:acyltransferase family protein n=1 Tax=Caulobacter sp. CCH9-E1 TaxID=1768768 RepID=UPI00083617F5|nr:acyltransferase [Caulobacter sp. CCH9-E1]